GADNILSIRLDNPANSSRWYPGGGIYRNVWLTKTAPVHVGQWGTYITTPEVSAASSSGALKVNVKNDSKSDAEVSVATYIYLIDKSGNLDMTGKQPGEAVASIAPVNAKIAAGGSATIESKGVVTNPKLWSPDTPNRYVAITTVSQNGAMVDSYETRFGIRTI